MAIIAIDPGCTESAWLMYGGGTIGEFDKAANEDVRTLLQTSSPLNKAVDHLAIEMIASYGMPVGREVFETVLWIGRFIEAWGGPYTLVYRREVKMHLCNSARAKDGNIRQALIDKFGPPGTKKTPGATYGISKDVWAALGVAVTFDHAHNSQSRQ